MTEDVSVDDLVPLAVQYRAMAASEQAAGNDEEYERLENQADRLYMAAEDYGFEFDRVPRLDETTAMKPKQTKPCEWCESEFEYDRSNQMYCSRGCRQKASYYNRKAA